MKAKLTVTLLLSMLVPSVAQAGLELPNGKVVFEDEKQQNSEETHQSLTKRSDQGATKSGKSGAWEAHKNSDKIGYQVDE